MVKKIDIQNPNGGEQDYCVGVQCPAETNCLEASKCHDGTCQNPTHKATGLVCDDGNFLTHGTQPLDLLSRSLWWSADQQAPIQFA